MTPSMVRRLALTGLYLGLAGVWLIAVGALVDFPSDDGPAPWWQVVVAVSTTVAVPTLHRSLRQHP